MAALVLSPSEYRRLLTAYERWYGALEHSVFDEVGRSVKGKGFYTPEELWQVAYWKVGSSRNDDRILSKHNEARVEEITRHALGKGLGEGDRLQWLYKLDGVSTPVASALLTVWNPADFAVIDRIIWDLCREKGWVVGGKPYDGIQPYEKFLGFCRSQRDTQGGDWTARKVEQALYALSEGLS